jgi:hypothetical protein
MWLFSRHGFFSVTKSTVEEGRLQIRARSLHDLQTLNEVHGIGTLIVETPPPADYRWRIVVRPEVVVAIMAAEVGMIDYHNFKQAVHDTPGQEDKAGPYMRVWAAMLGIQNAAEHQDPSDPDLFRPDEFTAGFLDHDDHLHTGRPEPEANSTCECDHDAEHHLHGAEHCLAPNLTGSGICACRQFTPKRRKRAAKVDPLHNPKAPAGKGGKRK